MPAVKTRRAASAPKGRKQALSQGLERLLAGAHLQNQATLVEMARNHAAAVLEVIVDADLEASAKGADAVRRAIAMLEKAHGALLSAELATLDGVDV